MTVGDSPHHSGLLTDLYELTMAAAYFESGLRANASFELFVRSLPPQRGYLVAAGLEQALEYLENLRFLPEEIDYLRRQPVFRNIGSEFFDYLATMRFSGEVWAIPEGTPVFGEEPLLRVTAPLIEAQIVETFLLATLTFQTMVASKAARIVSATEGRRIVDFGSRRAHGPEAGILAARAAYIGGCAGTSNVAAGRRFGIPVFGTLAHSFVMAHASEEEAFRHFLELFPEHSVLLVDTYDTLAAIGKIVQCGLRPTAIRLDSGNRLDLALRSRQLLDEAGLHATQVFATGDLDEYAIEELVTHKAPIDAFGVGTALVTSKDAPALGGVYKLVDIESSGRASYRAKFSPEKVTYPGRKQVFRLHDEDGNFRCDVIASADENIAGGKPLLKCVMERGQRTGRTLPLSEIQEHAARQLTKLPAGCRRLTNPAAYDVSFSDRLEAMLRMLRRQIL